MSIFCQNRHFLGTFDPNLTIFQDRQKVNPEFAFFPYDRRPQKWPFFHFFGHFSRFLALFSLFSLSEKTKKSEKWPFLFKGKRCLSEKRAQNRQNGHFFAFLALFWSFFAFLAKKWHFWALFWSHFWVPSTEKWSFLAKSSSNPPWSVTSFWTHFWSLFWPKKSPFFTKMTKSAKNRKLSKNPLFAVQKMSQKWPQNRHP